MEELDFRPAKSRTAFRSNYKLHDLAERLGKNLLTQWGFEFFTFGQDQRFKRVWEKGKDKPDLILEYKGNVAFLDWKGKKTGSYLVNERAIKAYEYWRQEFKYPVIIAFLIFNDANELLDRRFAHLSHHKYIRSEGKQWDKNITVEFTHELPILNKGNLIQFLEGYQIGQHEG